MRLNQVARWMRTALDLTLFDQRGELTLEQITGAVKEVVKGELKPVTDRLDAVEGKQKTLEREVVRTDADGKKFLWSGGEMKAPAHLSSVGKDSQPLKLMNIFNAARLGVNNPSMIKAMAGEEFAMSDRLKQAGYGAMTGLGTGSVLFPLAESLIMAPIDEKGQPLGDVVALRKEIGERLRLTGIDAGEIGWAMKRVPGLAQAFGVQQKDLKVGDDTLGGYLIETSYAENIIDLLRARLTVMKAGAREFPLPPTGNLTFRRLNADPVATYGDPDTTTDASSTTVNLGVVRLLAKALKAWITMPNDLLRYSSPSIEQIVRMALAASFAVTEDNQFLEGAGSSIAPKGIITYDTSAADVPAPGKLSLHVAGTLGTDGNTLIPEDIAQIMAVYAMSKDPDPATAWIMRPLLWAYIFNLRASMEAAGDSLGPFMFPITRGNAAQGIPEQLGDAPIIKSTNASNNRAKGSGTTLGYTLYGNFNRLLIGRVGVLELAVSEHVRFFQDKTVIRGVERHDCGLEHEESLVFVDTLLNS